MGELSLIHLLMFLALIVIISILNVTAYIPDYYKESGAFRDRRDHVRE
jgi:hypothetical protein